MLFQPYFYFYNMEMQYICIVVILMHCVVQSIRKTPFLFSRHLRTIQFIMMYNDKQNVFLTVQAPSIQHFNMHTLLATQAVPTLYGWTCNFWSSYFCTCTNMPSAVDVLRPYLSQRDDNLHLIHALVSLLLSLWW